VAGLAAEARFAELRLSVIAGRDPAIQENKRPGAIPAFFIRLCESTGSSNALPMTGSAKQSSFEFAGTKGWIASLRSQ
jgi:hypothetical protein